jgi:NhaA family Na+:H+ antiporter
MVFPALLYLLFNQEGIGARGWGVPMATDIAFALGVLTLLGPRVPIGLKVFLTALAIVDDIGAVLVIALFYTGDINLWFLLAAAGFLALLLIANAFRVQKPLVFSVLGIGLWAAFLGSGLHATLAGVLLAFTIPAAGKIREKEFISRAQTYLREFEHAGESDRRLLNSQQQEALIALEDAAEEVITPLQQMEHSLLPWVSFVIVPLFALANAGVDLGAGFLTELRNPISLGIVVGLLVGKQVGINLAAWLAIKSGLADLPEGVSWRLIYRSSLLAGIGFTMSLFIAGLAFGESLELDYAKAGILIASLVAGLVGYILLRSQDAVVMKTNGSTDGDG